MDSSHPLPSPSRSTAVTKRNIDTALMPPPSLPSIKRQKRPTKVVDEDVYNDALSHIIARDFFPGLLETEAQDEYLSALDSQDSGWIREAGRRVKEVMTPGPEGRRRVGSRRTASVSSRLNRTPTTTTRGPVPGYATPQMGDPQSATPKNWVGETPSRTPMTETAEDHFASEEAGRPNVDVNMSLGAFQAKYTSEDNESFNELLDTQNEKRVAKYAFFRQGNKIPTARQLAYRAREQRLLEDGKRANNSSDALITTNADDEQHTAVVPLRPSEDLSQRPASLDSFPNRQGARNHFMFGPESLEDQTTTFAQQRQDTSLAPPKSVIYTATRLTTSTPEDSAAVPPSPSMSAIDAAIAGRPKPTETESGYSGAETPRVKGYAFVDAEPSPSELGTPVTDAEAEAAERAEILALMPKAEEGAPNPFRIDERSAREDLLHRLVDTADVARRKGGAGVGGGGGGRMEELRRLGITPGTGRTPTPRFASAPKGTGRGRVGMTPAGRMLAASLTPGRGRGREMWTPTPRVKRAG